MLYVLIAVGGASGALARYFASRWVAGVFDGRFPLGTFVVNVSGSFLLGVTGFVVSRRAIPNGEAWQLALGIGFIGAYTTFSTFSYETNALLEDGAWLAAAANVMLSVLVGLLAVRAGIVAARWWLA
jgi:CrcB protein